MSEERSLLAEVERAVPGDGRPAPGDGAPHPARAGAGREVVVALGATPRISPRCTWQVVEGEAVVLDLQGRRLLGLNRAASFVFPLLDGDRTVAGLAAMLAQHFGIEVRAAEADLRTFLADLAQRGLVEGVER